MPQSSSVARHLILMVPTKGLILVLTLNVPSLGIKKKHVCIFCTS